MIRVTGPIAAAVDSDGVGMNFAHAGRWGVRASVAAGGGVYNVPQVTVDYPCSGVGGVVYNGDSTVTCDITSTAEADIAADSAYTVHA